MPYVNSFDGTRLWFDIRGQDGDPMLLIAGNACDHRSWDGILDEFAGKHRVIFYDHRGTGQSDAKFPESWSTRDFARDAMAVLHAAGFTRAHIYGHSMGGRIAQWLAADYPESTGALILGATSVGERHGIPRPAEATAAMSSRDPAVLQHMCYTDAWIAQNPGSAMLGAPNPRGPDAFIAHLRASTSHDAWEALSSITAPTLVIHGSDDRITLASNAVILARRIASARLLIVAGARHVYWAGFPQANDAVLQFIREHRF